MIRVELTSDLLADYTTRMVGIGGTFKVDEKDPTGIPFIDRRRRRAVGRCELPERPGAAALSPRKMGGL